MKTRNIVGPRSAIGILTVVAIITLGGCDLLSSEAFENLQPGTFRFTADGRTYSGMAIYRPNTDTDLESASITLVPAAGGHIRMRTDAFLTAGVGDELEPEATYTEPSGQFYLRESGVVDVIGASADHIKGAFRFRFDELVFGPLPGGDVTVDGGFHAIIDNG